MSEQPRTHESSTGLGLDANELSLEAAVDDIDDCAIFALDTDGAIVTWNAGSERIYGYQESEVVETSFSVFYSSDDVQSGVPNRTLDAAEMNGKVEKIERHVRKDGSQFWADVVITPLRTDDDALQGFTVLVRDATDQREREQAIRQRSVAMEAATDGMAILDSEGYVYVNEAHAQIYGYDDPDDLIGEHWTCLYDEEERQRFEEEIIPTVRQQGSWRGEAVGKRESGETFPQEVSLTALDDGGLVCVVRDITERKERERELQQERAFSESVLNAVPDVLYAFDEDGTFLRWNDRLSEITGYTDEEIAEMHPTEFVPAKDADEMWETTEQLMQQDKHATLESALVTKEGELIPFEFAGTTLTDEAGEIIGRVGTGRDITERKQRERERETRLQQQAAVTELGKCALEGPELDALFETVVNRVAELLDVQHCSILDLACERDELRLRATTESSPTNDTTSLDEVPQTATALETDEPVVISGTAVCKESATRELSDAAVESGISVVIGSTAEPWGVLETYDTDTHGLTEQDVKFVQSVATLLATAIEREQYERTLKRQRDELATLNQLHRLIEGLIQGLVEPASRDELERQICAELTEATLYADAWIGTTHVHTDELRQRAGTVDDEFRQLFTEHADDILGGSEVEDPLSQNRVYVIDDFQEATDVPPAVKRAADTRGYRAAISLPIQYGKNVYGWLFVHSPRPSAFNEREQVALETLAETAGFAINAVKQERLLRTDTVTEIELQATASSALFTRLATERGARCRVDEIIPATDDSMLHFLTVEGVSPDRVRAEIEAADEVRSYRMLTEQSDECRFEATVCVDEFLNQLIDAGTLVRSAVAESGNHRVRVQASPDEDIRELVSTVQSDYPEWSVTKKETVDRSRQPRERMNHSLEDRLTEKQLTALRTAYSSGYYSSPRKSTAQEIAADLDITDSTLHQHLQAAQRKLVEEALDTLVAHTISR